MKEEPKYAVIYGDVFDGVQGVVGPFCTSDEAETYMESHNLGHYQKAVFEMQEAE